MSRVAACGATHSQICAGICPRCGTPIGDQPSVAVPRGYTPGERRWDITRMKSDLDHEDCGVPPITIQNMRLPCSTPAEAVDGLVRATDLGLGNGHGHGAFDETAKPPDLDRQHAGGITMRVALACSAVNHAAGCGRGCRTRFGRIRPRGGAGCRQVGGGRPAAAGGSGTERAAANRSDGPRQGYGETARGCVHPHHNREGTCREEDRAGRTSPDHPLSARNPRRTESRRLGRGLRAAAPFLPSTMPGIPRSLGRSPSTFCPARRRSAAP